MVLELRSYHGASPDAGVNVLGSSVLFNQRDIDFSITNTEDAIQIPIEGRATKYTFVKNLRFFVPVTPEYWLGQVQLFFARKPGDWRGVDVFVTTSASYVDPVAQGSAALPGFTNNVNQYNVDSPLEVDGYFYNPDDGALGDYIILQAAVTDGADPGILTSLGVFATWEEWAQL